MILHFLAAKRNIYQYKSIMPTAQELRERRQARIKNGARNRLEQITKTALPDDASRDYKGTLTHIPADSLCIC